jgi:hypothetical protein
LIRLATDAGYRALFTIDHGANRRGGDLLRIRRTLVHGGCNDVIFAQMVADGAYRHCANPARIANDEADTPSAAR